MIKVHVSSPLLLNCIQSLLKSTLGFWLVHKSTLFSFTCGQLHMQWRDYPGLTFCSFFLSYFFLCFLSFFSWTIKTPTVRKHPAVFSVHMKGQLYRPDLIVWQILYQLARSGESQINPVWKSESPILCLSHVINTSTVCAPFIQINCRNPASCLFVGSAASKGP